MGCKNGNLFLCEPLLMRGGKKGAVHEPGRVEKGGDDRGKD